MRAALADGVPIRTPAAVVLGGAVALYALRLAGPVVVPVLVALLLAYVLEPLVAGLVRWRLPRPAAAAAAFFAVAVLAGSVGRTAAAEVASFLDDLPAALASAHLPGAIHTGEPGPLARLQQAASELRGRRAPSPDGVKHVTIVTGGFDVRDYLLGATRGILSSIAQLLIVAFLTFLLLATGDLYKRKLVRLAGPDWVSKRITLDVIREIDRQIERYLGVRVLISAIVATATAIPLWMLGVARPAMWGLVAGALNVMPFIGPAAAVALISGAAFLQFHTVEAAAAAGGAATVVAAIEGNVITPWIMGRTGELNTVAVFTSVLFWGWMWDVWGLLLAVPIMVAVKAAADRIEPLAPLGELLGR
jgi:predicted PurR-regulated permease PerM